MSKLLAATFKRRERGRIDLPYEMRMWKGLHNGSRCPRIYCAPLASESIPSAGIKSVVCHHSQQEIWFLIKTVYSLSTNQILLRKKNHEDSHLISNLAMGRLPCLRISSPLSMMELFFGIYSKISTMVIYV